MQRVLRILFSIWIWKHLCRSKAWYSHEWFIMNVSYDMLSKGSLFSTCMNLNGRRISLRFVDTMLLPCVSWQLLVWLNESLKVGQIQPSGAKAWQCFGKPITEVLRICIMLPIFDQLVFMLYFNFFGVLNPLVWALTVSYLMFVLSAEQLLL